MAKQFARERIPCEIPCTTPWRLCIVNPSIKFSCPLGRWVGTRAAIDSIRSNIVSLHDAQCGANPCILSTANDSTSRSTRSWHGCRAGPRVPRASADARRGLPVRRCHRDRLVRYRDDLCGLYTGIPLTMRSIEHSGTLPDVITIYREGIVRAAADRRASVPATTGSANRFASPSCTAGPSSGMTEDDLRGTGIWIESFIPLRRGGCESHSRVLSNKRNRGLTMFFRCLPILSVLISAASTFAAEKPDFYVSPRGYSDWSGRLAEPNANRTDGPAWSLARRNSWYAN